jgi:2-iminoacetate synthase ThiH
LDNFDHIQASWFSEGKKAGQAALHFGADDFGGTLYEENVHAEAGFVNTSTLHEIITLIHEAGFSAVQRTTRYDKLKVYPVGESIENLKNIEAEISLRKNSPTESVLV